MPTVHRAKWLGFLKAHLKLVKLFAGTLGPLALLLELDLDMLQPLLLLLERGISRAYTRLLKILKRQASSS
jgi:hypothetical protein